MQPFKHTPYAGTKAPFTIGLEPLEPDRWIEPDGNLPRYLREKAALFSARHDDVFRAHPDTLAAQQEALDLLVAHLPDRHPDTYRLQGEAIEISPTGERVPLRCADRQPLETAARLVQDDLVIMRRGPDGHELVAAAVCFPSSWRLADKFGLPLDRIHRPVPGYDGKMAKRMDLIFDRLPRERIVWRSNWSIYDSDRLPAFRSGTEFSHMRDEVDFDGAFLRVERQTLRRLPNSGDLLFTIMIYLDPLKRLRDHPDRKTLAEGLHRQLMALNAEQVAYKALSRRRIQLADYLQAIVTSA